MKTVFYYDEMNPPKTMRVVAPVLCMDHTFFPHSTFNETISLNDLLSLIKNHLFSVYAEFDKSSLYVQTKNNKAEEVTG